MTDGTAYPAALKQAHAMAVSRLLDEGPHGGPVANVTGVGIGEKWTGGVNTGERAVVALVTQKVEDTYLAEDENIDVIWGEVRERLDPELRAEARVDVLAVGELFAGQGPSAPTPHYLTGPASAQTLGGFAQPHYLTIPAAQPHYLTIPAAQPNYLAYAPPYATAGLPVPPGWMRPAMGGCSVGHWRGASGTMATAVYDLLPGSTVRTGRAGVGIPSRFYMLSNNHVLANGNDAGPGDPILQPAPFDGGRHPVDVIGSLRRFVPIVYQDPTRPRRAHRNLVDAAIAEVPFNDLDREVQWIGRPGGAGPASRTWARWCRRPAAQPTSRSAASWPPGPRRT